MKDVCVPSDKNRYLHSRECFFWPFSQLCLKKVQNSLALAVSRDRVLPSRRISPITTLCSSITALSPQQKLPENNRETNILFLKIPTPPSVNLQGKHGGGGLASPSSFFLNFICFEQAIET